MKKFKGIYRTARIFFSRQFQKLPDTWGKWTGSKTLISDAIKGQNRWPDLPKFTGSGKGQLKNLADKANYSNISEALEKQSNWKK